ncbi:N-acetylmuramoyl-L-alanine amidase family protein [Mesohalobacter halotolerans]|uniref:N-acetylmuramoyl-L-alanine amidase n=1 Tax=Mesohalobacter halotolerans TaxID=1883405 RepID=A0A4V6AMP2_9FLAO|nr:N-acetylmuramoyl-L-alanine amidase [Mesohalobacter halotolerans]TKS57205.1 N-acetylmuramoyl-L-alanine amidase [Mesohalobacter halotolerans]
MKNLSKFIGFALLAITMAFTTVEKKLIVIDVSHGGKDPGTSVSGFNEKEIALNIANKIKELNKNSNVEIILTRDTDKFLSLNERAEQINGLRPDFVISLHANATDNEKESGKEIFISDKNKHKEKSGDLALKLFYSFNDRNVEIKKADFYLLKNVDYPIALIELGYLTNEYDREILTTEKGLSELAESILSVIK